MNDNIMVSIGMATYNHSKFIAEAIESVLMQNVNFKYEIIIGDDCSPDNTQSIIMEYAQKYPEIIKPILREKNIGGRSNFDDIRMKSIGKYYITLEGDDYWTDANKLQEQVDFLEKNSEYIGVSHWCEVVDEEGNISNAFKNKYKVFNMDKEIYTISDFKKGIIPGHTTTLMHRNIFIEKDKDYIKIFQANPLVGDRTLHMILTLKGNIYCIHKIMSHYRYVVKTGGTSYSSRVHKQNICYDWFVYYSNLELLAKEVMNEKLSLRIIKTDTFVSSIITMLRNPSEENKKVIKKILEYSDEKTIMIIYCLPRVFIRIIRRIISLYILGFGS